MFFKITVKDKRIIAAELMNWDNDQGYQYSLYEVLCIMEFERKQFRCRLGLFDYGIKPDNQLTFYIVEASCWSLACLNIESLLIKRLKNEVS